MIRKLLENLRSEFGTFAEDIAQKERNWNMIEQSLGEVDKVIGELEEFFEDESIVEDLVARKLILHNGHKREYHIFRRARKPIDAKVILKDDGTIDRLEPQWGDYDFEHFKHCPCGRDPRLK